MGENLPRTPGARLPRDALVRPVRTYRVKMVLLGSSGVGKSSLAVRFVKDDFKNTSPTVGCEFTMVWYHTSHLSTQKCSSIQYVKLKLHPAEIVGCFVKILIRRFAEIDEHWCHTNGSSEHAMTVYLWRHKVTEVPTAGFKSQFLNIGCALFCVDTVWI